MRIFKLSNLLRGSGMAFVKSLIGEVFVGKAISTEIIRRIHFFLDPLRHGTGRGKVFSYNNIIYNIGVCVRRRCDRPFFVTGCT